MFGVAAEGEMGSNRRLDEIRQILEIPGGKLFCPIVNRHGSCERQSPLKSWPLRQDARSSQMEGQRRIAALKKLDHRIDHAKIGLLDGQHAPGLVRQFLPLRTDLLEDVPQACPAEQAKHHLDAEVCLPAGDAARAEKAGEIGRRGVGCVQLRQRGDQQ